MTVRKPTFFILGAPKCGTTSLAHWLAQHPEAAMSRPKEPHYFSFNRKITYQDDADYERCFAHVRDGHRAVGDGSTNTFYFPEAIERILAYQPQAKFIVCLRNPSSMAVSYHNHLRRRVRQPIADFAEAWEAESTVFSWYQPEDMRSRDFYRYQCALGSHYERLVERIPEGRLLTLLLEDIQADTARELRRVTDFLGIAPAAHPFPKSNPARSPRIKALRRLVEGLRMIEVRLRFKLFHPLRALIDRFNMVEGEGIARPDAALRQRLAEHFDAEVTKLERLLGRDLSAWRAGAARPDGTADTAERRAGAG